jgi:hypothetical protein
MSFQNNRAASSFMDIQQQQIKLMPFIYFTAKTSQELARLGALCWLGHKVFTDDILS